MSQIQHNTLNYIQQTGVSVQETVAADAQTAQAPQGNMAAVPAMPQPSPNMEGAHPESEEPAAKVIYELA